MSEAYRVSLVDYDDKDTIGQIGAAIKDALAEEGKGKWLGTSSTWLGTKAVEAVDEAVGGLDLMELFGTAWATAADLQSRADRKKFPADKPNYVKLGKHTVKFDVTPALVISLAGWESQPIAIMMELSALINAMELKILDGHIVSIHGGECDVGLKMKLAGKEILKRKTLKKFKLDAEHVYAAPGLRLSLRQVQPDGTEVPAETTEAAPHAEVVEAAPAAQPRASANPKATL